MGSAEVVRQAAEQLYGCDPAEFTQRRAELAAQARAAGDRAAAKQIADLRKPTRSAWVVNQLVRADPSAPGRLAALAEQFRAGQAAADGAALRRLSTERRHLIDSLVRQALAASGERASSAALREDVAATLGAALADPRVAASLAAGTLTRAEAGGEFGSLLGIPAAAQADLPPAGGQPDDDAAARIRAEAAARAEQQRQQAIARAEQVVADAILAADAAAAAQRDEERAISELEQQLMQARQRLQQARLRARQATSAHRNAVQALRRLPR